MTSQPDPAGPLGAQLRLEATGSVTYPDAPPPASAPQGDEPTATSDSADEQDEDA